MVRKNGKENSSVRKLKMMFLGITMLGRKNEILQREQQCLDDNQPLTEYGLSSTIGKAQAPATLRLAIRFSSTKPRKVREPRSNPAVKSSGTAGRNHPFDAMLKYCYSS